MNDVLQAPWGCLATHESTLDRVECRLGGNAGRVVVIDRLYQGKLFVDRGINLTGSYHAFDQCRQSVGNTSPLFLVILHKVDEGLCHGMCRPLTGSHVVQQESSHDRE